jgi:hypothetical protein
MTNNIFETFYYRMLPLFKPQAEQILRVSLILHQIFPDRVRRPVSPERLGN